MRKRFRFKRDVQVSLTPQRLRRFVDVFVVDGRTVADRPAIHHKNIRVPRSGTINLHIALNKKEETKQDSSMRVLMISKALVAGTSQRKLEELARCPGVELTL